MRALASSLEASRTFEAPLSPQKFKPNVDLGPKVPPFSPYHRRFPTQTAECACDTATSSENRPGLPPNTRQHHLSRHAEPASAAQPQQAVHLLGQRRVVTHPSVSGQCPVVLPPPGFAALQRHDQ
jgi:hypothetical protein